MDLTSAKQSIIDANFSQETKERILNILKKAEENGGWTEEEKRETLALVDSEIQDTMDQAVLMQNIAQAFEKSLSKAADESEQLDKKLYKLEDRMIDELDGLEKDQQKSSTQAAP